VNAGAAQIGGWTLVGTGLLLLVLALLIGVQKRRNLVNGVDWRRVARPDALLSTLGATLAFGGASFALAGVLLLADAIAERWVGAVVGTIGAVMGVAALALIARAQR
jgi:hypothetical protein